MTTETVKEVTPAVEVAKAPTFKLYNQAKVTSVEVDDETGESKEVGASTEAEVTETFEDRVNKAVDSADRSGESVVFADDTPDDIKYAANLAIKAESAENSVESSTKVAEIKAEIDKMRKQPITDFLENKQDIADLEELKSTDPEAWRVKCNDIERQITEELDKKLQSDLAKLEETKQSSTRTRALAQFNKRRGKELTLDDVNSIVPNVLTKSLNEGKITFEKWLSEAEAYLDFADSRDTGSNDPETAPDVSKMNKTGTGAGSGAGEALTVPKIAKKKLYM